MTLEFKISTIFGGTQTVDKFLVRLENVGANLNELLAHELALSQPSQPIVDAFKKFTNLRAVEIHKSLAQAVGFEWLANLQDLETLRIESWDPPPFPDPLKNISKQNLLFPRVSLLEGSYKFIAAFLDTASRFDILGSVVLNLTTYPNTSIESIRLLYSCPNISALDICCPFNLFNPTDGDYIEMTQHWNGMEDFLVRIGHATVGIRPHNHRSPGPIATLKTLIKMAEAWPCLKRIGVPLNVQRTHLADLPVPGSNEEYGPLMRTDCQIEISVIQWVEVKGITEKALPVLKRLLLPDCRWMIRHTSYQFNSDMVTDSMKYWRELNDELMTLQSRLAEGVESSPS